MSRKYFIVGGLMVALTAFLSGFGTVSAEERVNVDVILDRVVDLGTFETLDFEIANNQLSETYDLWAGGCTAVAKTTDSGDTIIGRNMDLFISDRPAFVCRTKVPGNYETIGVGYTNLSGVSFEEAVEKGIPEAAYKSLPYRCADVLNEKGLYCEINMRNGECYPNGTDKFGCSGTNPDAEIRTSSSIIPRLVGEKCATVKEAVEYLKNFDFYTFKKPGMEWNFCFVLADATGDYGLVEIAENEIIFLDKQQAQTNFYITEKYAEKEEYKCGLGRYEVVMNGIDDVQSEDDIYNLIKKVSYYQSNFPDECQYDWRTENVGVKPYWTTDYVLDEANRAELLETAQETAEKLKQMTREEIAAENAYWESVLTTVTNCNNRTMMIRFFEDDNRIYEMGF